MGSSIYPIQREARFKFETPFAFMSETGGLGASLVCTGASARTQFVGAGQTVLLHNLGASVVFFAWGEVDVIATLQHIPVLPGPPTLYTMPATDDQTKQTYFAGITAGDSCLLMVHRGWGC